VATTEGQPAVVAGPSNPSTIPVTNIAPSPGTSGTLPFPYPPLFRTPSFGAPSAGSYNAATGVWSGLSLATGQSVTITLTGTIDPAASGSITNTAHVEPPSAVTDTNPNNNTATDTDTIAKTADLTVAQ